MLKVIGRTVSHGEKMRNSLNKKGITLLELMVVLSVIGIMATIAFPNYLKMLPHMRLKSAASDVASAMQNARMMALAKNKSVTLSFNTSNNYFLYNYTVGNGSIQTINSGWTDVAVYNENSGITVGVPSPPLAGSLLKVKFSSDGTTDAPDSGEAVYIQNLSDHSKKYRVKVDFSGIVSVEQFTGAGWSI